MSVPSRPHFRQADKARKLLESIRWPNGATCPRCGSMNSHYALRGASTRDGLWKCKDCREQFSVTVGTIFERSKVGLDRWMRAVYLLCSSRKPISILQLTRELGVTYKTAWYMSVRIRDAFKYSGSDSTVAFGGKGTVGDTARQFARLGKRTRAQPG